MASRNEPSENEGATALSRSEGEGDDRTVEVIRKYIAEKLGFFSEDKEEKSESVQVLEDVTLDGIVKYIKDKKCKKIVTMAGAGISTSAGIPDFRSPGSGLYHNLQKYNLPDPQDIFEIQFFKNNPKPFFALAKEMYPGTFKPTVCHYFIRLLAEKQLLLRHYTQNIDTLERVAGIPGEKLVEAHGTFHTSHCLECKKEYPIDWMKEQIFSDIVPTCTKCNGIVKPDIVFFGENLPTNFFTDSTSDFPECDLLIILGSSLKVQPFASLIDKVGDSCPRLLINREKAGQRDRLMQMLGMGAGMDFDSSSNRRDVFYLGDCDSGCQLLADKLGWGEELNKLVKLEYAKIDELNKKSKSGTSNQIKSDKEKKDKEEKEQDLTSS
uniref:NAD-dependent protein deacetylase n=1 Tax=Clastoptera arizonana TaxID=38151 RepID=A0A1B6EET5_9HEMI